MISVMALSSSKGVMGPYPVISFCIKLKTWFLSKLLKSYPTKAEDISLFI